MSDDSKRKPMRFVPENVSRATAKIEKERRLRGEPEPARKDTGCGYCGGWGCCYCEQEEQP